MLQHLQTEEHIQAGRLCFEADVHLFKREWLDSNWQTTMHGSHMQIDEHHTPIRLRDLGAKVVYTLAVKGKRGCQLCWLMVLHLCPTIYSTSAFSSPDRFLFKFSSKIALNGYLSILLVSHWTVHCLWYGDAIDTGQASTPSAYARVPAVWSWQPSKHLVTIQLLAC